MASIEEFFSQNQQQLGRGKKRNKDGSGDSDSAAAAAAAAEAAAEAAAAEKLLEGLTSLVNKIKDVGIVCQVACSKNIFPDTRGSFTNSNGEPVLEISIKRLWYQ